MQASIKDALANFPTAEVENRAEYQDTLSAQLDQIVYLLYALLAMSVLISLFGIANSLFLSIHERTSELGVLRAIGTTAGQVRRMVRYESVITAVIGGVLGIALGIVFAWLLIESLSEFDLQLSLPVRPAGRVPDPCGSRWRRRLDRPSPTRGAGRRTRCDRVRVNGPVNFRSVPLRLRGPR